jgi:D-alanyl-lipoteichoic acid acyltransferase DltB (MBOAT superfamily)
VILGFELTVILYCCAAAAYWVVKRYSFSGSIALLLTVNVCALSMANFFILAFVTFQILLVFALYVATRASPRRIKTTIPWLAFAGLLPLNFDAVGHGITLEPIYEELGALRLPILWWVGGTFLVIKSFVMLRDALKCDKLEFLPTCTGLTFLPSYSAGPIHGTEPYLEKNIALSISRSDFVQIVLHVGWGGAAFYVIGPAIRSTIDASPDNAFEFVWGVYASLAALFFDFSGYTFMALAMAKLFGVTLPENFNRPYLARSIQDFWQRWHISLSKFVATYIFKPFVRSFGMPRTGIFIAFVFAGVWHKFSIGYLLWGIGHGAALSLAMKPPKFWTTYSSRWPQHAVDIFTWFLTITWVASLSYLAVKSPI